MTTRTSPWWPVLVAAVAVLVHLNTLGNGFTLDDVPLVRDNPKIASIARAPSLLVEPYWDVPGEHYGLHRPATTISLALNRSLAGPAPLGYHLGNVLLHAAASALAWFALRRAGVHYGTALLGGLLFAVLPIHTEAVANVAGRAELLAAVFALGAWIAHRRGALWTAGALYLGAVLSKESAVAAPLLYLVDDLLRRDEGVRPEPKRYAPYGLALAGALALRIAALGAHQTAEATIALDNPAAAAGSFPRILTALWVQVKYVGLCVWPQSLSSDYSFDAIPTVRSLGEPRALAGIALAGLAAAAAAWGWRRSRPVVLAIAAWAVFMLASANLLFPTGTLMGERLAYLPSLGICLLVAHAGAAVAARGALARRVVLALSIAVVALLGVRTWARNPAWKDNLTLALTDVKAQPRSAKLQAGAGLFLEEKGRVEEAEAYLRRAVEIDPSYAQMHYNLGVLLARRGASDEAAEHFRRAIELAPGNPLPRRALADLERRK